MLTVCPLCSNMLIISPVPANDPSVATHAGNNRFECRTCPYQMVIDKRYYERKYIKKKEVDDVIGGKGAWDNVDKTSVQCPDEKCRNDTAYWYQLQIRSADEPMTAFYKCTKCSKEWRE
ncbi:uncharacterized protein BDR25DRAFT_208675 [Lindgomyces ingoldianus]|uniref:Uncharacterized protein n=1 Tax=Lindgomyces ingoldianus TaxID=673940 RepID=A0ACB6RC90_9PLEO|nr:uncharacterized protein BDR25DRAFT_208675 [Lindgomyces ingoldianus]KAF2476908.1 hypothetical protein BDR25DRAFT_208675 [Lindgomyces ingoldianus]